VDRVLAHFHDDVVFTSPVAARLVPGSDGYVRGKPALREYWREGLRQIPDLNFTIEQVFAGVDTLVIQYRNQKGVAVSEILVFEAGKVRCGHGTYPVNIDNPAGAQGTAS
jgi:ketosteroid isomerase-like protein